MMRIVMTEAELDALPAATYVLTTDGLVHGHNHKGSRYPWSRWGSVSCTSALLADGRPILVLWDPSAPEVLLDLWGGAMAEIAPDQLLATGLALIDDLPGDGGAVFNKMIEAMGDVEMESLAALDFINCWSKRYSVST